MQYAAEFSELTDRVRQRERPTLIAYLKVARPENVAITALAVFIAGVISNTHWPAFLADLLWAALSASLIAAGGNTFNDICDRDLDGIQKPHRPIPAGEITLNAANVWAAACFLVGLLISLVIGTSALLIASWAVFLLLLYSWRWKRLPLVGNLTVALVAALAFLYGGVAVQSVGVAFWAAWLAFFFHLGREIVKDLEDQLGDATVQANTLVVRYGQNAGRNAASMAFLFLILSLPFPYYLGQFQIEYLHIVLIGVLPVIILAIIWLWCWKKPEQLHRLSVILKWDMLVGLAALLVGRPDTAYLFP